MKIELRRVRYMPAEMDSGVLYLSDEFGIAIHLCPCGCGTKIKTPLGPTDWIYWETKLGVSLWPSIGNWQENCQSHYWIRRGRIRWAESWTPEQIGAGRRAEEAKRDRYYRALEDKSSSRLRQFRRWASGLWFRNRR